MNATQAALRADPKLSRFDPLGRIIYFDDFNQGFNGWTALAGNYEHSLDSMHPGYAQYLQPQISNLPHWEAGSHGGMSGNYALKIPTRPRAGAQSTAIKRVTFRKAGRIQMECYFTFKPQATELRLSETDLRAFGVLFDLQDDNQRVMPHLRFLNALDGKHIQRWQYKEKTPGFANIGTEGKTVTHYHLAGTDWVDLPGGEQRLCYNEIPTKVNWTYLKLGFDLESMRYTEFQCNDHSFDVSGLGSIAMPAMRNLWCMLNLVFFVETDIDKRAFAYIDSVLLSGDF